MYSEQFVLALLEFSADPFSAGQETMKRTKPAGKVTYMSAFEKAKKEGIEKAKWRKKLARKKAVKNFLKNVGAKVFRKAA